MSKERRKSENAALRDLIDALKNVINARDALWSLGFFDRLFRFEKCRAIFNEYDEALAAVRNAVRGVMDAAGIQDEIAEDTAVQPEPGAARQAAISLEEFEVLLGKPRQTRKS